MNKKPIIWIAMLLICIAGVMATCITDGDCTRYVAMDISPCMDNIRLDTPVLINITTASCNASYNLQSPIAGLTSCPVSVFPAPVNYSGFVSDWITYKTGDRYNYWDLNALKSSLKSNCENISMRITLYRDDTNEQILQDWTAFNLSWQLYTPYMPVDGIGFQAQCRSGIWYPSFGIGYNTTAFNKSGDYMMRVQVKGNVNLTVSEYNFNFTVNEEPNGFKAGECTSTNQNEYAKDTDVITKVLEGFGGFWTKLVLYLLIMVIIAVGLYFGLGKATGKMIWLFIALVEFIMLIIGAYIHIISWIFVAAPVLVLLLWGAWKIKEVFS